MSWLDECHEVSGYLLRTSSSTEALDAAVQLSSLDELCGTMPSLDSISFLDNDVLPVPLFKYLGRNKTRNIKCHRERLRPSSSMKSLDAAVQLSLLDPVALASPSLLRGPSAVVIRLSPITAILMLITPTRPQAS